MSGGTALARLTGVVRVVVIGAVLGPTTLGNAFQIANSLPNLVYYGFLAGSLVSSLLVPALVRHLAASEPTQVAQVARRFLGLVLLGSAGAAPLLVAGLPWLVHLTSPGGSETSEQVAMVTVLVALTAPQIALYAVAGTGAAVMYAHRRFALPACAPAVENVVLIAVFAVAAAVHGAGSRDEVATSELLLLGLGSTAAVGVHAALQWWGARRCGVFLLPARGWADPELRGILRRAAHSMAQAGLLATQTVALLVAMARVPGGVVALQIALNFYFLPVALVVTPVGIAALPRLSRLHQTGDAAYWEAFARAVRLVLFLVVPAAAGYVALAGPIARVVGVGAMDTPGAHAMIATALGVVSVGLAGHAVFFVSTQASYAADDSRRPLRSMALQTTVCLCLVVAAVLAAPQDRLTAAVAAAYVGGCLAGGTHLLVTSARGRGPLVREGARTLARVAAGTLAMAPAVLVTARVTAGLVSGRAGALLEVLAGSMVGCLVFAGVQLLLRAPELGWLGEAFRRPVRAAGDAP